MSTDENTRQEPARRPKMDIPGSPRAKVAAFEELAAEAPLLQKPTSVWKTAWQRLRRRRTGVAGMVIIGFWVLVAIFAPLLATHDPENSLIGEEENALRRSGPCVYAFGCPEYVETDSGELVFQPEHYMGLDGNARDVYSRIVFGSRLSLTIGLSTVTAAVLVGVLLGSISGFWGGWIDNLIMRVMDVVLGFPSLLLAIVIVAVLGPGLQNAVLGIVIVTIPQYARVMRASVLSIRELDYVSASRALGSSKLRILVRRILPNALTPIVVLATLGIASAILEAAGLSFLGLGAQPPTPEWGTMLGEERNSIFAAPHLVFFPGIAIMITVLGFNLLGDGMRDALDPQLNV